MLTKQFETTCFKKMFEDNFNASGKADCPKEGKHNQMAPEDVAGWNGKQRALDEKMRLKRCSRPLHIVIRVAADVRY